MISYKSFKIENRINGTNVSIARRRYRSYVKKGIPDGKRTDLTGGGLIRSTGGWSEVKAMQRAGVYLLNVVKKSQRKINIHFLTI